MGRPTSVTQTDIARAVKVATDAGLRVHEIVLEPRKARIILASGEVEVQADTPKAWPK